MLVVSVFFSYYVYSQNHVKGYVFNDENNNKIRESKEKGIPGVGVTNGVEVVLTDEKGYYLLPATDDMIVSVIKPSNYAVPVNENNQPEFYYIHKPNGSPKNKYVGVKPTGDLPKRVNFPLYSNEENSDFSVILFGDPQPDSALDLTYFDKAIVSELLDTDKAVLGISLGDLGIKEVLGDYISIIGKIGVPWYNVLGNHDLNGEQIDKLSDETFEYYFGPTNYAFNYADAHFIMLDDVLYPDPRDGKGYLGGFRDDILRFIENDLKHVDKDKLIILGFHIPIFEFEPGPDQFQELDVQKLFDLLKGFQYTISLSGHTHSQNHHFFTKEEGWPNSGYHHHYNPGATSGSVYKGAKDSYGTPSSIMRDGTPKGYAFLNIKGNTYDYDYVPSGDNDLKMSIHIPKIVPMVEKYRGEIVVNFFQGSPWDNVEYRVDNGDWVKLKLTSRFDKYLLDVEYEWDHAEELPWGTRNSTPLPSSHIWSDSMPSYYSLGDHTLQVKATDWLGRTFFEEKSFKMVPDSKVKKHGF
ncbi:calcineurin-like phosphoesterase C-terminal domain-containing protein [Pseudotamlana agarivorans]|uniref:calcineurin-like phosphoesterase C-terminal domain-containing protein n=1 Tax=Pseudotamlana agarivorans TaxID=481183 RepID=UPI001FDFBF71|nr:calcineurin-like phosphoesterase family protein [Tamlana agarivorans]